MSLRKESKKYDCRERPVSLPPKQRKVNISTARVFCIGAEPSLDVNELGIQIGLLPGVIERTYWASCLLPKGSGSTTTNACEQYSEQIFHQLRIESVTSATTCYDQVGGEGTRWASARTRNANAQLISVAEET